MTVLHTRISINKHRREKTRNPHQANITVVKVLQTDVKIKGQKFEEKQNLPNLQVSPITYSTEKRTTVNVELIVHSEETQQISLKVIK